LTVLYVALTVVVVLYMALTVLHDLAARPRSASPRNRAPRSNSLVLKAHRLLYHLTLGSRVIQKKEKKSNSQCWSRQ